MPIFNEINIFLLLGGIFLITFFLGLLLEKIKIPWIFAALILGLMLAFKNPFSKITSSDTFIFLAWLGMYFLLFLIGFELDLEKIKKLGWFIVKSTFFIIFFEAVFGVLIIHYFFGYGWVISTLVALSFATVGEAVLIPILDEFGLTKTKLGQSILGVGILDDIIEVFIVVLAVLALPFLLGTSQGTLDKGSILIIFLPMFVLFILTFGMIKFRKEEVFLGRIKWVGMIYLLILAIFFIFIGLGKFAEASAIGALLAGLTVKNFLPKERIKSVESEIKSLTYGFFGPIFFFWVGVDININYLKSPFLILLVVSVVYSAKILASYLVANKELGKRPSIFMGIALGVRFSTSLVIIKFLFESSPSLIGEKLYSVLIAATIVSLIIPFFLSLLIPKWKIASLEKTA